MSGLNDRSRAALLNVHKDLVAVVERAALSADFIVTEGMRSPSRQAQMVATGRSQVKNSRHLTGHAVDVAVLVKGQVVWEPLSLYGDLARVFKQAAFDLGVPLKWGGDWPHFKDADHFELDRVAYPDPDPAAPAEAQFIA